MESRCKVNYGWRGTLIDLFSLGKQGLVNELSIFLHDHELEVGDSQIEAWKDCYDFFYSLFSDKERYSSLILVFEYMLPLEKMKRPDVIILLKDRVIVLEFKRKSKILEQDIEQAILYREGLKNFHYETYDKKLTVEGFLVLTRAEEDLGTYRDIKTLVASNFIETLHIEDAQSLPMDEEDQWLASDYHPIPSMVEATLTLFQEGELPQIKSIQDSDIEQTVTYVKKRIFANQSKEKRKDILFVSGVPGAGKTLVALKTLYDYNAYQYNKYQNGMAAIYLSGNGPLISVLQEQLQDVSFNQSVGKTYIHGVFAFKKEYLKTKKSPPFHAIFFDEAQRAWDQEMMKRYHMSEPEGLLQVGEKIYRDKGSVTIVCFIGDGQAIHFGEEKGLALWVEALKNSPGWRVFVPPNYTKEFQAISSMEVADLHLKTSIRSNFINTSGWIEALLKANLEQCKEELANMKEKGYIIRLSHDYTACKQFIEEQASYNPQSTFGLLVSSKASERDVRRYTSNPGYLKYMKDTEAGKWFLSKSKTWSQGATEFICQGLELDFPLVCFGGDYYINDGSWEIDPATYKQYQRKPNEDYSAKKFNDFSSIVDNIYRVLLSRARKGMVIYIPKEEKLQQTYDYFKAMGIKEI
jgi:DUF2075 family protein